MEWYQPAFRRAGLDDVVAALGEAAAQLHGLGHPIRLLVAVNAPTGQGNPCIPPGTRHLPS